MNLFAEIPYPRIANCYGAGLAWATPQKIDYLNKVSLFLGTGGWDFHYDWDSSALARNWDGVKASIRKLKAFNPNAIVLSYVDVAEGPPNPDLPSQWWQKDSQGNPVSHWPGYNRINTGLPEVIDYNVQQIESKIAAHSELDGVFLDVWSIDTQLVPRTKTLRDGKFLVMVNDWNLPKSGLSSVNGVLSEDELNRVVAGKVSFEDFLQRYLVWSSQSLKPALTTIVCHPRTINDDAWRWAKLNSAQRQAEMDAARTADPAMLRFGLGTTLLGDGFFAYDAGTMNRGNPWWYTEFDAPLGTPVSEATRGSSGSWTRKFTNGEVIVNPSPSTIEVKRDSVLCNFSTGLEANSFTIGPWDAAILVHSKSGNR